VSGTAFALLTAGGAALLALWVDARLPRLAPRSVGRRFAALLAAGILLQLAASGFEAVLASTLDPSVRSLAALAVLLAGFTLSFLTAVWLLRALSGLAGAR
jgi:hypothetical protein